MNRADARRSDGMVLRRRAAPPLCLARCPPQSVAACRWRAARRILCRMGSKSRETLYGSSVRAAAERAAEARKQADRLACDAWNKRMLVFQGPAQPSPALGDALNAGYRYLEVRCLGCNTHQTVALDIVRRPKTTPVHELERYIRCRDCSRLQGRPYKRSHLVALRPNKISASIRPRRGGRANGDTVHPLTVDGPSLGMVGNSNVSQ